MQFQRLPSSILDNLLCRSNKILLERTDELLLLCRRLVCTMTELAARVDPLELDLLKRTTGSMHEHGLAESHDALLHAWH